MRVLIVEDDATDEALIRRELQRLSPRPDVRRVTDESAFVDALGDFAPDVILCDHDVPSFGGRTALATAQRLSPETPFLVVTRSVDAETAVAYLKAGAADYILKERLIRLGPAMLDALTRTHQREAEIAERKQLQEQLIQAQKMEAVGQLAGGVAHDFNNILTAIAGYADLLASEFAENSPQLEDVEEIRRAARQAAALTRQLLSFSRKQVLTPRVVDVNGVVGNLDKMLRSLITENIELKTHLADGLHATRVDPNQLEQIIMNLAINARDAMPPPGAGALTIKTGNVTLDADYAARHVSVSPGDYVMLAVSDTGCGMSEEIKARLFEPFFTTKPEGRGTGLGLSTVYGIVSQSGGNIWLDSEPGRGTTFKIYLPAIDTLTRDNGKSAIAETGQRSETPPPLKASGGPSKTRKGPEKNR